jgi:hypothetical protein
VRKAAAPSDSRQVLAGAGIDPIVDLLSTKVAPPRKPVSVSRSCGAGGGVALDADIASTTFRSTAVGSSMSIGSSPKNVSLTQT